MFGLRFSMGSFHSTLHEQCSILCSQSAQVGALLHVSKPSNHKPNKRMFTIWLDNCSSAIQCGYIGSALNVQAMKGTHLVFERADGSGICF